MAMITNTGVKRHLFVAIFKPASYMTSIDQTAPRKWRLKNMRRTLTRLFILRVPDRIPLDERDGNATNGLTLTMIPVERRIFERLDRRTRSNWEQNDSSAEA